MDKNRSVNKQECVGTLAHHHSSSIPTICSFDVLYIQAERYHPYKYKDIFFIKVHSDRP